MNDAPTPARPVLIVVKRVYFDAFAAGTKTIELRRHRGPFTAKTFYPGRLVRIAFNYDVARYPSLIARVVSFDVQRAGDHPELVSVYPDLPDDAEIAAIGLAVVRERSS